MPQIRGLQVVFAKREATEGTDPVPTATDALQLARPATLTWGDVDAPLKLAGSVLTPRLRVAAGGRSVMTEA